MGIPVSSHGTITTKAMARCHSHWSLTHDICMKQGTGTGREIGPLYFFGWRLGQGHGGIWRDKAGYGWVRFMMQGRIRVGSQGQGHSESGA